MDRSPATPLRLRVLADGEQQPGEVGLLLLGVVGFRKAGAQLAKEADAEFLPFESGPKGLPDLPPGIEGPVEIFPRRLGCNLRTPSRRSSRSKAATVPGVHVGWRRWEGLERVFVGYEGSPSHLSLAYG